jgi:hypothetical protein
MSVLESLQFWAEKKVEQPGRFAYPQVGPSATQRHGCQCVAFRRSRAHWDLKPAFLESAETSAGSAIVSRRAETYRGNGSFSNPLQSSGCGGRLGSSGGSYAISQEGSRAHGRSNPCFFKKRRSTHDDSLKVFVRGPETCVASETGLRDARGHRCVGYLLEKSRAEENIEHTDFDFGREKQVRRRTSQRGQRFSEQKRTWLLRGAIS